MSNKELKELFDEVRKLFNLKRTEFVVDPNLITSECDTYTSDGTVICYLKEPIDAIHEGVHAFFEEYNQRLWEELGEEEYKSKIDRVLSNEHLEEVTARLIEVNVRNIELKPCNKDTQKTIRFMVEKTRHYKDIELGKKILRLYLSIYEFRCICPKDIDLYNSTKNDIDPITVYNKLARYIGTHELYPRI